MKARLLGGFIGNLVLKDLVVEETSSLGRGFLRVVLGAPWIREAPPGAGDKVQVFVPDVGSRTFTPCDVDAAEGRFSLVIHMRDEATPAMLWARGLGKGTTVRVVGPGSSTPLVTLSRPVALFGDETSFGVAKSLVATHGATGNVVRLEVSSMSDTTEACAALALPADAPVLRAADGAHHKLIAEAFAGCLAAGGSLVLTGRALSIQSVRSLLAPHVRNKVMTRAYWAEGKRGLD
jgi:NADPH-dependent ferric siderophore reductase